MKKSLSETVSLNRKEQLASAGLTLIEILISVAVLVVLAAAASALYRNYVKVVELDVAGKDLIGDLKDARTKAMSGQDDLSWGVHAVGSNTSSYYQVFSTTGTYSGASTTITTYLQSGVVFTTPAAGSSTDVIFSKLSGSTTSTSLVISSAAASSTRTINISTSGNVY